MIKYLENENDFSNEVKEGTVLVDFYADWCGPCRMLGSVLEEVNESINSIKILKVNVDNNPSVARDFSVMSIPTIIVYKNGNIINKKIGFSNKEEIIDMINE